MRERMKAHALDGFSLIAGLLFAAIGVLVAVDASPNRDVDPRWIVAVLLVGLGLAGVLGTIDWSRPDRKNSAHDDTDEPNGEPEPAPDQPPP